MKREIVRGLLLYRLYISITVILPPYLASLPSAGAGAVACGAPAPPRPLPGRCRGTPRSRLTVGVQYRSYSTPAMETSCRRCRGRDEQMGGKPRNGVLDKSETHTHA